MYKIVILFHIVIPLITHVTSSYGMRSGHDDKKDPRFVNPQTFESGQENPNAETGAGSINPLYQILPSVDPLSRSVSQTADPQMVLSVVIPEQISSSIHQQDQPIQSSVERLARRLVDNLSFMPSEWKQHTSEAGVTLGPSMSLFQPPQKNYNLFPSPIPTFSEVVPQTKETGEGMSRVTQPGTRSALSRQVYDEDSPVIHLYEEGLQEMQTTTFSTDERGYYEHYLHPTRETNVTQPSSRLKLMTVQPFNPVHDVSPVTGQIDMSGLRDVARLYKTPPTIPTEKAKDAQESLGSSSRLDTRTRILQPGSPIQQSKLSMIERIDISPTVSNPMDMPNLFQPQISTFFPLKQEASSSKTEKEVPQTSFTPQQTGELPPAQDISCTSNITDPMEMPIPANIMRPHQQTTSLKNKSKVVESSSPPRKEAASSEIRLDEERLKIDTSAAHEYLQVKSQQSTTKLPAITSPESSTSRIAEFQPQERLFSSGTSASPSFRDILYKSMERKKEKTDDPENVADLQIQSEISWPSLVHQSSTKDTNTGTPSLSFSKIGSSISQEEVLTHPKHPNKIMSYSEILHQSKGKEVKTIPALVPVSIKSSEGDKGKGKSTQEGSPTKSTVQQTKKKEKGKSEEVPPEQCILVVPRFHGSETVDVLKEINLLSYDFRYKSSIVFPSGAVLIICYSEEEADHLRNIIKNSEKITTKHRKIFPRRVQIYNLPRKSTEEEIIQNIFSKYKESPKFLNFVT